MVAVLRPGKVAEHPPVAVHPAALHSRRQLWHEAALGHLLKDVVIIRWVLLPERLSEAHKQRAQRALEEHAS